MSKKSKTSQPTKTKPAKPDGPGFWDVVAGASLMAGAVAFGAALAPTPGERERERRERRLELERQREAAAFAADITRMRTVVIETAPAVTRTVVVNDSGSLQWALANAYAQLDCCNELDFTRKYDLVKRIHKLELALGIRG